MEKEAVIKYKNDDITIVWKPKMCIHSKLCWKQLGVVFKPAKRPWVDPKGASTERIMEQIDKCPSGALSYYNNKEEENIQVKTENIVEVMENGPLLVYGNITVKKDGGEEVVKNKVTAFCRCGQSGNKPYCDGSHTKINFKG
ncbi:MAG: (4Fe-4S)-binding protein [Bacteroidetes bacterium]|nr:(4Fe-4S)-binding protein [Bacteroidota bacterium]